MVLKRPKIYVCLLLLCGTVWGCSDFRAIFNGKPQSRVAKKDPPPANKAQAREIPKNAQDFFVWPLNAPVSSLYGKRNGKFHDGIDINGEKGDPVVAAAAGDVVFSGKLGGYGRLVVIRHENGMFTAYAHNKKNYVEKGARVKKGEKIAQVGRSGSATGDHLHFEIRDKKGTYDPLDFLPRQRYSQRP